MFLDELPVRQRSAAKRHEGAAAQSSAQMPSPNPAHTAAYQWYAGTQGEKALEYVFDKFTNIADSGVEMSRETDTQDITLNFKYQGQHLQVNFPYNFPISSSFITSGGDRIVIGGDTTETAVSAIINSISSVKPQAHLRSNPAHMAADQWYAGKQAEEAVSFCVRKCPTTLGFSLFVCFLAFPFSSFLICLLQLLAFQWACWLQEFPRKCNLNRTRHAKRAGVIFSIYGVVWGEIG